MGISKFNINTFDKKETAVLASSVAWLKIKSKKVLNLKRKKQKK
ncbi:hypothetical protein [Clostridium estertheticum]|nr:hypothetical protein [Clostridium estertheticum]